MRENDEYIEITSVRLGVSCLGYFAMKITLSGSLPEQSLFLPIYVNAAVLFFVCKRISFRFSEACQFRRKFPVSFFAYASVIVLSFGLFISSHLILYNNFSVLSPFFPSLRLIDCTNINLIAGWIWLTFSKNLLYKDLVKSFSEKTIEKYISAPLEGWLFGIMICFAAHLV